ncbi:hypothetical protein BD410DRAFT_788114 [Rickenella mellea]|uniref:Uncharacterized protein n=1 Tax=Rickenella mellea TaxID=50990 RepID=A0A4Y7Q7H3_9AGAM|nr:hypothetical protein BD410DRAFT_788114 [Rickenella mellea]
MDEPTPSSNLVLAAARSISAALRVPYALCGGAACVVLGSQRETKAIALVVPRGSTKAARTEFRAHPAFKVEPRTNYTTFIGEPLNAQGTAEHTELKGIPLTILSPPGLFSYNYTGAERDYVLVDGIRVLHPRFLILTKVVGIADRPMKKIISDANDVAFLMEKLWNMGEMVSLGELGFTSDILDKFVEIVPNVRGVLERMGYIP